MSICWQHQQHHSESGTVPYDKYNSLKVYIFWKPEKPQKIVKLLITSPSMYYNNAPSVALLLFAFFCHPQIVKTSSKEGDTNYLLIVFSTVI